MRVERAKSTSGTTASRRGAPADGAAFSSALGSSGAVSGTNVVTSSAPVASVDAVMALQGLDDAAERRERSARRGRRLIDSLERLKLAALDEDDIRPALQRLQSVMSDRRENSGDNELEAILDQIELRAEVELAKAEHTVR